MSQYICIILFTYENMFGYWKDKFCNWYDEDNKYICVVNDVYEDKVLDHENVGNLKLSKTKDDFKSKSSQIVYRVLMFYK